MISENAPRTEERVPLHDQAAFIYNRRIWPLGAIVALIAAPFVLSTEPIGMWLCITCLAMSVFLISFWLFVLPKIKTETQLDSAISVGAIAIYGAVALGAYAHPRDVTPFAICTIGLSLAFATTRFFVFNFIAGLALWGTALWIRGEYPIAISFHHALLLAPATAFFVRQAIAIAYDRIKKLRDEEQRHSSNLIEAYDRLKDEEQKRHEYEAQLAHMQKVEGLGALATGIAHDFNNYLMAITSLSENIGNVTQNSTVVRDADEIHRVAINASQVCTQILTFAGNVKDEKLTFRIKHLFEDVHRLLRAVIPNDLNLRLGPCSKDFVVYGDRLQLQQVLLNFVKNAADARREDGTGEIEISIHPVSLAAGDSTNGKFQGGVILESGEYVQISIWDNGKGIVRSDIPKIFDPYFSTKRTGHGLGLAVSLGIIRRHGGAIRCESQLGDHTLFDILLPRVDSVGSSGIDDEGSSNAQEKPRRHVLLIDDEQFVLTAVSRLMANIGWSVSTSTNGKDAFDLLNSGESFEAVLLDYSMPLENGLELLQRIRAAGFQMPIVLCSGLLIDSHDMEGMEYRPNGILKKPYSLTAVNDLLSKLTESESTS
jgi:signal transduction histidine kinase/CheY-like chemotaxis protein